jgi:hypothetical protein
VPSGAWYLLIRVHQRGLVGVIAEAALSRNARSCYLVRWTTCDSAANPGRWIVGDTKSKQGDGIFDNAIIVSMVISSVNVAFPDSVANRGIQGEQCPSPLCLGIGGCERKMESTRRMHGRGQWSALE